MRSSPSPTWPQFPVLTDKEIENRLVKSCKSEIEDLDLIDTIRLVCIGDCNLNPSPLSQPTGVPVEATAV
ncbi:hypothetical protein RRG08_032077 [Elysia crispata]|uniref:Uncharacterized protein n=1 Tax=Elysia crispata TaxID=231223 RepID=A0AAE0ZGX4_9GAST|nr:hypothetical protein RRG08_032077 [Elysia crispata]